MAEDNCELKNEYAAEETAGRLVSALPKQEAKSVPQMFFASLNQLSRNLDSEVSHLEARVKSNVSRALSSRQEGEFGAPIADDMHDELQELNR